MGTRHIRPQLLPSAHRSPLHDKVLGVYRALPCETVGAGTFPRPRLLDPSPSRVAFSHEHLWEPLLPQSPQPLPVSCATWAFEWTVIASRNGTIITVLINIRTKYCALSARSILVVTSRYDTQVCKNVKAASRTCPKDRHTCFPS